MGAVAEGSTTLLSREKMNENGYVPGPPPKKNTHLPERNNVAVLATPGADIGARQFTILVVF